MLALLIAPNLLACPPAAPPSAPGATMSLVSPVSASTRTYPAFMPHTTFPALAQVTAQVTVAGVDTDRLYPVRLQQQLVDALPRPTPLQVIRSPSGHDGFLVEAEQVDRIVADALA